MALLVTGVWLALAGLGCAQASQNSLAPPQAITSSLQAPSVSRQVAPSDMGASSTTHKNRLSQEGRSIPAGSTAARTGGALNPGGSAISIPRLCFQPGTGWVAISVSAVDHDNAEAESSFARGAGTNSHLVRHPRVSRGFYSGARSSGASECPSMPRDSVAKGISREDSTSTDKSGLLSSDNQARVISRRWPQGKPPSKGASIDGDSHPATELNQKLAIDDTPTTYSSIDTAAQLKTLKSRAYLSSVRLRRLSRNVPDLKSRLELRRIQGEFTKRKTIGTPKDQDASIHRAAHKPFARSTPLFEKAHCDRITEKLSSPSPCSRVNRQHSDTRIR
jgi:hypothetical protein